MAGALRINYNTWSKMSHLPQPGIFFKKNIKGTYILDPFVLLNYKKKSLRVDAELWSQTIFSLKMAHLPERIFPKNF